MVLNAELQCTEHIAHASQRKLHVDICCFALVRHVLLRLSRRKAPVAEYEVREQATPTSASFSYHLRCSLRTLNVLP